MTPLNEDERIAAVAKHGKLTRRQAGFLVLVMVHSGVCVRRQYCAYAHIRHGQKVVDFFSSLVTRRAATRYTAADGRGRIFTFTVGGSTPPSTSRTTAIASRSPWPGPSSG